MKPEEAINLLRDYQRHYPQAIQDYRARTGRRNGWLPGEEFLRQVNPHGDWGTTLANLKAIANFWRSLIFGPNQNIATGTARTAPDSPKDGSGSDETTPDLLQLLASEEDARLVLAQVESVRRTLLDSITFPPSYKPLRQRLRANGERLLCACRGQAEGRSFGDEKEEKQGGLQRNQRQIADECGCSQPTIQRDIKLLETWAGEIAVDAAELLKTTPGFEKLGRSETLIDEVAAALCELLLKPLNYGEQALLCQAIDHHLHSS
jgi:hypothetical protein